jgi:hypothetical protein
MTTVRVEDAPSSLGLRLPAPPYDQAEWRRSDDDARAGLVFVDGHSDFRHPGHLAVAGLVELLVDILARAFENGRAA